MKAVTIQHSTMYQKICNKGLNIIFPEKFVNRRKWSDDELIPREKYFEYYNNQKNSNYDNFFWVFTALSSSDGMLIKRCYYWLG